MEQAQLAERGSAKQVDQGANGRVVSVLQQKRDLAINSPKQYAQSWPTTVTAQHTLLTGLPCMHKQRDNARRQECRCCKRQPQVPHHTSTNHYLHPCIPVRATPILTTIPVCATPILTRTPVRATPILTTMPGLRRRTVAPVTITLT